MNSLITFYASAESYIIILVWMLVPMFYAYSYYFFSHHLELFKKDVEVLEPEKTDQEKELAHGKN